MADTDVGKRATRVTEDGDEVVCDIIAYSAGRDAGDHYVFGGSHPDEKHEHGDVFTGWAVVGTGPGSIRIH